MAVESFEPIPIAEIDAGSRSSTSAGQGLIDGDVQVVFGVVQVHHIDAIESRAGPATDPGMSRTPAAVKSQRRRQSASTSKSFSRPRVPRRQDCGSSTRPTFVEITYSSRGYRASGCAEPPLGETEPVMWGGVEVPAHRPRHIASTTDTGVVIETLTIEIAQAARRPGRGRRGRKRMMLRMFFPKRN